MNQIGVFFLIFSFFIGTCFSQGLTYTLEIRESLTFNLKSGLCHVSAVSLSGATSNFDVTGGTSIQTTTEPGLHSFTVECDGIINTQNSSITIDGQTVTLIFSCANNNCDIKFGENSTNCNNDCPGVSYTLEILLQTLQPYTLICDVYVSTLTQDFINVYTIEGGSGSSVLPISGSYIFDLDCNGMFVSATKEVQEDFQTIQIVVPCGNGQCNPSSGESFSNCPQDCVSGTTGAGAICGNSICETGEDFSNCPSDCQNIPYIIEIYNITTKLQATENCVVDVFNTQGGLVSQYIVVGGVDTQQSLPQFQTYVFFADCNDGSKGNYSMSFNTSGQSVSFPVSSCGDGYCLYPTEDPGNCGVECIASLTFNFHTYNLTAGNEVLTSGSCSVIVQNVYGEVVNSFGTVNGLATGVFVPMSGLYVFSANCVFGYAGSSFINVRDSSTDAHVNVSICGDFVCNDPYEIDFIPCPSDCSQSLNFFVNTISSTTSEILNEVCTIEVLDSSNEVVNSFSMQGSYSGGLVSEPGVYTLKAFCPSGVGQTTQSISSPGQTVSITVQICGDLSCIFPETFDSCAQDCGLNYGVTILDGQSLITTLTCDLTVTSSRIGFVDQYKVTGSRSGLLVPSSGQYTFNGTCSGILIHQVADITFKGQTVTLKHNCGDNICISDEGEDVFNCEVDCSIPISIQVLDSRTNLTVQGNCTVQVFSTSTSFITSTITVDGFGVVNVEGLGVYLFSTFCPNAPSTSIEYNVTSRQIPVTLYVTPIVCGDGTCDDGENSTICPQDCSLFYNISIVDSQTKISNLTCDVTISSSLLLFIETYQVVGNKSRLTVPAPGQFQFDALCSGIIIHDVVDIISPDTHVTLRYNCSDNFCVPSEGENPNNCPSDCAMPISIEVIVSQTSLPVQGVCSVNITSSLFGFIGLIQTVDGFGVANVPGFGNYSFYTVCENASPDLQNAEILSLETPVRLFVDGAFCGDGICSSSENQDSCPTDCACCFDRQCGYSDNCPELCGVCPVNTFCNTLGMCSTSWNPVLVKRTADECGNISNCYFGPNGISDALSFPFGEGNEIQVSSGVYCGGFIVYQQGTKLRAIGDVKIVPCEPTWWEPGPPECQQDGDTAPGTPCWLGNNLITVHGSSVSIEGFLFDGRVPNELLNSTDVFNINPDGTLVGAARGISNLLSSDNRTAVPYPLISAYIKNNTFTYLEDSAIDFGKATISASANRVTKMGTVGLNQMRKRQDTTERERGNRKRGRKGAGVSYEDSAGEAIDNYLDGCNYAGMDGAGYDPTNFPFKKRDVRQTVINGFSYETTVWSGNTISNSLFGGLIIENMKSGSRSVKANIITGTDGRGLIIEDIEVPDGSLNIQENNIQGVRSSVWIWKTKGMKLLSEAYSRSLVGVHVVNCNPYEDVSPSGPSNVTTTKLNIKNGDVAYLVEDEPGDNDICKTSTSPLVLKVEGGSVNNVRVALETVGQQVDTSDVSTYTEDVDEKVVASANSQGQTASADQLPPDCPLSCNGKGECAGINICECEPGYHQNDCSEEICGDTVCTEGENLDNCAQDCDITVLPSECANYRGFSESQVNTIMGQSAVNKNIQKLTDLLDKLNKVNENLPEYLENCCSVNTNVDSDYPLDLKSITGTTYDFYYQLRDFNNDNQAFLIGTQ